MRTRSALAIISSLALSASAIAQTAVRPSTGSATGTATIPGAPAAGISGGQVIIPGATNDSPAVLNDAARDYSTEAEASDAAETGSFSAEETTTLTRNLSSNPTIQQINADGNTIIMNASDVTPEIEYTVTKAGPALALDFQPAALAKFGDFYSFARVNSETTPGQPVSAYFTPARVQADISEEVESEKVCPAINSLFK